MKKIVLTIALMLICATTYAGKLTVRSKFMDLTPNDGFMDSGSYSNPLIIQNDHGQTIGEIRPRIIDLTPGDNFMDAGSYSNPMEIELY